MIRLIDLLKEIKVPGKAPNEFLKTFLSIVIKKYPESTWIGLNDDHIVSEESGDNKAVVIAWSIKVPALDPKDLKKPYYVGIVMQEAFTKKYEGVLGTAIKTHIDTLLRQHKDSMPALFLTGENWAPDVWEHIAKKYNLELIEDDTWEDFVQVADDPDDDDQVDALIQSLP